MQIQDQDVDTLAHNWWAVSLRGVASMLFGLFTFVAPAISLLVLVLTFAAYAIVDGIFVIAGVLTHRDRTPWGLLVLQGVAGIATGIATVVWPSITALVLLYVIAGWVLLRGSLEIVAAIRLRKTIRHEWMMALSGLMSLAMGLVLLMFPATGELALTLWIGAFAFVLGPVLIALGLRLHGLTRSSDGHGDFRAAAG